MNSRVNLIFNNTYVIKNNMEDIDNSNGLFIQFQKLSKVSGIELNNFFGSSFFDGLCAMKKILESENRESSTARKILDKFNLGITDIISVHANSQGKAVFVVSDDYEYYACVTIHDGELVVCAVYDNSTDQQVYPTEEDLLENTV